MKARAGVSVLAGIVVGLHPGVAAADWKATLSRPLSPGAVALLAPAGRDPTALARLAEALRSPEPEVRAAAARVITVIGGAELLEDLWRALATETDSGAAREEIRAAVTVGPVARD